MGWFDEQIKTRINNDRENFENSFINLSSVVMGRSVLAAAMQNDRQKAQNAIEEILKFYHVKKTELPETITELEDILEYLLRPSGIMRRSVSLTGDWYKDGIGALLGHTVDGEVIALIPDAFSGHQFYDYKQGKNVKVTAQNRDRIAEEAICFYKPLPLRPITMMDLIRYIMETLAKSDYVMLVLATLAVTLLGMFTPMVNNIVFSQVIPSGKTGLILPIACMLIGVTLSSTIIGMVKTLVLSRITTKIDTAVSAAAFARVMSLPVAFFKGYSSGELANRTNSIKNLCTMLVDAFLTTGLTSLFSLTYVAQIFAYAPALVVPALVIILGTLVFSFLAVFAQLENTRRIMESSAKLSGLVFGLFSGVQKIKLSGAEKRAFSQWAKGYQAYATAAYAPPVFTRISSMIPTVITLVGTIVLYYSAIKSRVSMAEYMAFNTAYGMVSGAMSALAGIAYTIASIKPTLEMVEPILKAAPEVNTSKRMVEKISGAIELNNVTFRYSPDTPVIIDNLSLKIRAGQYVAIVGKTGCGKSTLMRLILGFETPQKGAIFYDGKDMNSLDLKSLRRKIGVVMQNGKLFSGDIYSNIAVSAPGLSPEDAMKAAEAAGMAEDIRNMPMGLHTIISEGGGGISGGQRQRLMIARAIAPKPKLLMFDEATSALDNLTQKQVSESLDKLKCTRIVIAHRLSTIRQCDRIIVLDKGKIVEDGNYESLIAKGGFFAELVERQRVDT